jgi:hypothetical protein
MYKRRAATAPCLGRAYVGGDEALRIQIGGYRLDKRRADLLARLKADPPTGEDRLYESALRLLTDEYETTEPAERARLMSVAERNVSLYFTLKRMG